MPVEIKKDVSPAQRLLYQLQSEGAELEFIERNKAWAKLWEISREFETKKSLAKKLGIDETVFSNTVKNFETYRVALSKIGKKITSHDISYETLVAIGKEDKGMIKKAVREKRPAAGRFL